jgi:drug/metabolite transporter (DMT)-like permease
VIGGVRRIGSTRTAVAMLMEPVVAVAVAAVALGQRLTELELVGGVAILVAVVLVQLPARTQREPVAIRG